MTLKPKVCKPCGEEFTPNVFWQKFCSNKCRARDGRKRWSKGKQRVKKKV